MNLLVCWVKETGAVVYQVSSGAPGAVQTPAPSLKFAGRTFGLYLPTANQISPTYAKTRQSQRRQRATTLHCSDMMSKRVHIGADNPDDSETTEPVKAFKTDGTWILRNLLFEVHEFLKAQDHPVCFDSFEQTFNVDLAHPHNAAFLDCLKSNRIINVEKSSDGCTYISRRPTLCVNDAKSLRTLVLVDLPLGNVAERDKAGAFGARWGITCSDLQETYAGVRRDLEEMVTDGELVSLAFNGTNGERVYFRNPGGVQASSFLRDLWHSVELPRTQKEIVQYLTKSKLRDQSEVHKRLRDDVAMREQDPVVLKAKALEAKKAARKQAKKGGVSNLQQPTNMKALAVMRRRFGTGF